MIMASGAARRGTTDQGVPDLHGRESSGVAATPDTPVRVDGPCQDCGGGGGLDVRQVTLTGIAAGIGVAALTLALWALLRTFRGTS